MHFPCQTPSKPGTDKSKYCRFYKSHRHNTDDCIQLKDAIEILIRDGHLKKYKRKDGAREEAQETKSVEEEKEFPNANTISVSMSITIPEDFYFPNMEEVRFYL